MPGRDPNEKNRASTPLELFFDLVYVIAIFNIATGFHHAITETHNMMFIFIFFEAIFFLWWSWMNYTWFASAYANDDFYFKILSFFQIFWALLFATNVTQFFTENPNLIIGLVGFLLMRGAMILQWLRAAKWDPKNRDVCLRYAGGLFAVQFLWTITTPFLWQNMFWLGGIFIILELLVPVFAENGTKWKNLQHKTPWHTHHIAERYGLLTIIMLGEGLWGIFRTLTSFSESTSSPLNIFLIFGGLVTAIIFALWWSYFQTPWGKLLHHARNTSKVWFFGYGHYFIYAALVAVGVGFDFLSDIIKNYYEPHSTHAMSPLFTAIFLNIALAIYMFSQSIIRINLEKVTKKCLVAPTVASIFLIISAIFSKLGVWMWVLLFDLIAIIVYIFFYHSANKK